MANGKCNKCGEPSEYKYGYCGPCRRAYQDRYYRERPRNRKKKAATPLPEREPVTQTSPADTGKAFTEQPKLVSVDNGPRDGACGYCGHIHNRLLETVCPVMDAQAHSPLPLKTACGQLPRAEITAPRSPLGFIYSNLE